MTILAYDMKTLSTDSLYSDATEMLVGYHASKIFIVRQKMIAFCGCELSGQAFIDWVIKEEDPEDYPLLDDDFSGVLIDEDRVVTFASTCKPIPQYVRFALGHSAAAHYAIGLMDLHVPVPEAVRRACGYSLLCGEPVYSLRRDQLKLFPKDYVGLYTGTIPSKSPKKKSTIRDKKK